MMKFASCVFAASLFVTACVSDDDIDPATSSQSQSVNETRPKHVHPAKGEAGKGGGGHTVAITYHGGPVMTGTPSIHYIWYGNWSGNTATTILTDLANGIGGSPYEQINATYYNASNTHVSGNITYGGSVNDNYSHGTSLTDAQIEAVVAAQNPTDTNAIYMVLTSADVTASSGFCTQYCGWHTDATINGRDIKYAFIGNPDRCPSACEEQTTSPNGNAGADGMASIISHESEEAISDPDLNAWYDRQGAENADKCAWTFGNESTASNGSKYNQTFGGRNWLIQRNWNASTQGCQRVLGSTN
jgi:archaellum component FlaF (FlaF/FlaG flagellin family)